MMTELQDRKRGNIFVRCVHSKTRRGLLNGAAINTCAKCGAWSIADKKPVVWVKP